MRRTLLVLGLAAVVGASFLPVGYMFPAASAVSAEQEEDDTEAWEDDGNEEEWDKWVDKNIDGITFRSTKKSVASVNGKGKVKGRKKGSTIIKTTVVFRDGSEGVYKTKVYVK